MVAPVRKIRLGKASLLSAASIDAPLRISRGTITVRTYAFPGPVAETTIGNRAQERNFLRWRPAPRKCQILSAETVTSELIARNVRQMRTSCEGLR